MRNVRMATAGISCAGCGKDHCHERSPRRLAGLGGSCACRPAGHRRQGGGNQRPFHARPRHRRAGGAVPAAARPAATTRPKASMSASNRRETALEPITRVASGTYAMGFADINALIKFRDANPKAPVKAVFMVYNRPPYAVIAPQEPRHRRAQGPGRQEARRAGRRSQLRRLADFRQGQRHRRRQGQDREYRPAGARADAGRRPGRRHHRPFVLILHQSQGQGRAGRGHRRAADGRLRRRSLRQCHHRQQPSSRASIRERGAAASCAPSSRA